ncbi:hypothetical protein Fot_20510 [Forsythia ovata]|uniref:Uncharacterized protein n=1 Tax=Forsythia ovata TaxID=205694 RepID=A0ABD1US87_9LAMI
MDRKKLQQFIPVSLLLKNVAPVQSSSMMHSWKPWDHVDSNPIEKPVWNEGAKKNVDNKLRNSNSGSHILDADAYPFIDLPVVFNFGNDYGNQMFHDLIEEFSYENSYKLAYGMPPFFSGLRTANVYKLSSEEDMIEEFLKNKLFES